MGTDKRLVLVDGQPMLRRAIDGLPDVDQILVVIDPARPVPRDLLPDRIVRVIPDLRPGAGPLAGLEAGLAGTGAALVLVVPVDMPWLGPDLLRLLVTRLGESPRSDVACLVADGRRQPLPMACRRGPALARVTRLLDGGEHRLRALVDDPATAVVAEADWRAVDGPGRSIEDVDTPADLARHG